MATVATTADLRRYVDEKVAAEYLGFKPCTIRQSRWSGYLAGHKAPRWIKFGRSVRYDVGELDRWARTVAGEVQS
ncbi:hypothetical protein [Halomonas sp.]|uniref:hypothetical protein n=1 Tax=Halomonas sp. TaxID=1486246 RepID=UPI003D0A89BB